MPWAAAVKSNPKPINNNETQGNTRRNHPHDAGPHHPERIRAVRVDEIAQKLEISKRTLYELFSDKDTLVEQCWDKIREEQEKKIAGYLFYQPGSALEQARNLIQEYIAAVCMISCISLQELQQKVSYADS